jgi:DNA polymerase I
VKVTFWLLDINAETTEEAVRIWLWGIDDKGNRVLVIDENFVDYFYVLTQDGFEPSKIAEEINKQKTELPIGGLEIVPRKYFGRLVNAIRVYCSKPSEIAKLARLLRDFEGVKTCLEDDIRLSMRYLVDNNIIPCSWHEVETEEHNKIQGLRASRVYSAKSYPRLLERTDVPALRKLSFSIARYSSGGMPRPEHDPILIISTISNNGERKLFFADDDKNDKLLIENFMTTIQEFDPDLISGFGTNAHDWNYLKERCHALGLKLSIDRTGAEPHTSVYGHISLTGMANIDIEDFMEQFPEVKVKTLRNLADHLEITKAVSEDIIEEMDISEYWDNKEKRVELKSFMTRNASIISEISNLLLSFAMQLSSLSGLPLDHVMTAAVGFRVDWFLIRYAQRIAELIPKRVEHPYTPYAGGLVLEPQPGLHQNIAVLDFKSMYPSIMLRYNLSPDTYIASGEQVPTEGFYEAPEVAHKFRKAPPGFYKEVLSYLLSIRKEIQAGMNQENPRTVTYKVLDSRQKAVKIITNAVYGYAGWTGARWYARAVSEAASAWGRSIVRTASDMAKKAGLNVIYGDTDSLFVDNDKERILHLEKEIEREFGLVVNVDQIYERVFFTEAKKRYAGLRPDGSLDIVGFEVIRGDWAEVAKHVQENVLKVILEGKPAGKAVDYVRQMADDLRQRKVPFRDLIIWKTLTRPAEEYSIRASHVEAALTLAKKGWHLTTGDKVGYVIMKGKGRLYNRVKPYVFATYDEVDADYYLIKQILPAAARVLEFFGINEEDLLKATAKTESTTKSLTEYLK